jgi:hypothetical protein
MKTILTLLLIASLALLIYNRQRIYLRDPLATVYRNDVQQTGVEVFINYFSDVLLQQDAEPAPSSILLQDWNKMPGTPTTLTCLRWIACMTNADQASAIRSPGPAKENTTQGFHDHPRGLLRRRQRLHRRHRTPLSHPRLHPKPLTLPI